MAQAAPKLSWANVVRLPPKPNVLLYVDSYYQQFGLNPSDDYIKKCVGQAKKQYYPYRPPIFTQLTEEEQQANYQRGIFDDAWERWILDDMNDQYQPRYLVATFEEEMLMRMTNPRNPDTLRMIADFQWIANKLSCNIVVFLGHKDQCAPYVEQRFKQILEQQTKTPLYPKTIFLIIACEDSQRAHMYNTDPAYKYFQDKNVAFFGFEDFMHFHAGEIYSCKEPLRKVINVICDYDGIEQDIQNILKDYKHPIDQLDTNNPLYKCCHARLEHIFHTFVDELYERATTKYTKENLYEKFKAFAESSDRSVLTEDYVTIKSVDGTPCVDKKKCKIPNPFVEEEEIRKNFNKRGLVRTLFKELEGILWKVKGGEASPELFWKRIQNLVGDEQKVFTFKSRDAEPILFFLLNSGLATNEKSHYDILAYIFDKYGSKLDYTVTSYYNYTVLEKVLRANVKENEIYSLIKKIYDSIQDETTRETVFLGDGTKNSCVLCKPNTRIIYPVFKFYIQTFGSKLKDVEFYVNSYVKGNLLHRLMLEYKDMTNSKAPRAADEITVCFEGLLANGVNPNQYLTVNLAEKRKLPAFIRIEENYLEEELNRFQDLPPLKPLELHMSLFIPPYNQAIFKLLYKWGMTDEHNFLGKMIEVWNDYLQSTSLTPYKSLLKINQALLEDLQENEYYNYDYNQSGGWRNRYNNDRWNNNNNNSPQDNSLYYFYQLAEGERILFQNKMAIINEFRYANESLIFNYMNSIEWLTDLIRNPRQKKWKEPFEKTIALLEECKRIRRAVGKHGSKFRRTRKQNKNTLNQTIKRNLNKININLNPEGYVNKLMNEIFELAKKPQFTREEKANFKSRPITIKKSSSTAETKIAQLQSILDSMKQILQSR